MTTEAQKGLAPWGILGGRFSNGDGNNKEKRVLITSIDST